MFLVSMGAGDLDIVFVFHIFCQLIHGLIWYSVLLRAKAATAFSASSSCVQYNAVRLWNMDSYKTLRKPNPVLWEKMLPEDSKDRMDTKGH